MPDTERCGCGHSERLHEVIQGRFGGENTTICHGAEVDLVTLDCLCTGFDPGGPEKSGRWSKNAAPRQSRFLGTGAS